MVSRDIMVFSWYYILPLLIQHMYFVFFCIYIYAVLVLIYVLLSWTLLPLIILFSLRKCWSVVKCSEFLYIRE